MPQPGLPPTPGSSSDIKGQDGSHQLGALHLAFELPPPAIHDASRTSPTDYQTYATRSEFPNPQNEPPRASFPMQAAETVKSRRRSSAAKEPAEGAFALPPPPTRSRKIIQMKPKSAADGETDSQSAKSSKASGKAAANTTKQSAPAAKEAGKKKQPSATSVAGRKIARKTAHSLIERRRRSKMNEEFALLKSMIPACTGEMHKLAILQASIEYLRYLEDCVAKLKVQHDDKVHQGGMSHALPSISEFHPTFRDEPVDVEMSDPETASPTFTPTADRTAEPTPSPALAPQDSRRRQHSYSSVSTDHRHYSFSTSAATSPAFGPQRHQGGYAASNASAIGSALTSPALEPQSDLDQEATAALLMLNTDRRGVTNNGRVISVRDLLSA